MCTHGVGCTILVGEVETCSCKVRVYSGTPCGEGKVSLKLNERKMSGVSWLNTFDS